MDNPQLIPLNDAAIEAAARALHDEDIREQAVDMAYPECADYYRGRAAVAVTEYLATTRPPERHDYEGNWPYEPCRVCGRTYPGDFDVHNYIVRQGDDHA